MLRKPTEWLRVALDQQGSAQVNNQPVPAGGPVLAPEEGAPAGTYRRVQLGVPSSPPILVSLQLSPTAAGPNRTGYQYAPAPPNKLIVLRLQPEQQMFMTVGQGGGLAICSLIVEYCEAEANAEEVR